MHNTVLGDRVNLLEGGKSLQGGSGQPGSMEQGQLYEIQQSQVSGPAFGSPQPCVELQAGAEWLQVDQWKNT